MADLVKALVGTGKDVTDLVAAVLILVGGLLIMGALVFRVFIHPEWTFGEALSALWPFLTLGFVGVALGWLVDRLETSSLRPRDRRRAARRANHGAMGPQDTRPIG
jgi:hypothetical protein